MHSTSDKDRRRTVRSFVRRAGRLTPPQRRALRELWPRYGIDFGFDLIDLEKRFGRRAPVVLEIGFGNGDSLIQQARQDPGMDFLGIEVHEPGIGHCLLQARDAGLSNLRIIRHDALEVLAAQVPPLSLRRVNVYFPDPWPKKRHHKRRMLQPAFLGLIHSRLEAHGTLHIATDWENYAAHIDDVLQRSGQFRCDERREHAGDTPLDRPTTKFERRGLGKGHRIVDWRLTKIGHND